MKNKNWIFLLGGILLISIVALFSIKHFSKTPTIANIYKDGELIKSVELKSLTTPVEIPIINKDSKNIILAEPDGISMKSANCPDRLCMHQGKIHDSTAPIVCLPNRIVIQLTD